MDVQSVPFSSFPSQLGPRSGYFGGFPPLSPSPITGFFSSPPPRLYMRGFPPPSFFLPDKFRDPPAQGSLPSAFFLFPSHFRLSPYAVPITVAHRPVFFFIFFSLSPLLLCQIPKNFGGCFGLHVFLLHWSILDFGFAFKSFRGPLVFLSLIFQIDSEGWTPLLKLVSDELLFFFSASLPGYHLFPAGDLFGIPPRCLTLDPNFTASPAVNPLSPCYFFLIVQSCPSKKWG